VILWQLPVSPTGATSQEYAKLTDLMGFFWMIFLRFSMKCPAGSPACRIRWWFFSPLPVSSGASRLIDKASTTFEYPYYIASRFGSLRHTSDGRAGWNIVIISTLPEARNFGRDILAPHEEPCARARDMFQVTLALWNSQYPDPEAVGKIDQRGVISAVSARLLYQPATRKTGADSGR